MVTGAADDDPSGIATYSQAGAQLGNPILWTMVFTWPLMSAIQMICGQIGRVTGRGVAANMRKFYGRKVVLPMVLLLLISNVFNLGADIGAMGSAATLLFGGSEHIYAVSFTIVSVVLQVFIPYRKIFWYVLQCVDVCSALRTSAVIFFRASAMGRSNESNIHPNNDLE